MLKTMKERPSHSTT